MDSSFYGGQPGTSFIIVAYYETVDEMIENFKKGPDYEAVHFDEHVLINTYYKDDPDNGKIYRRGYDYTNEMGGAVYVGTIVGPPGHSPMVEMTTVADVLDKYNNEEHDEHILSEGSYAPFDDLVPGKDANNNYVDSIRWACCSIHNKDHWYTTAYIGFIWPYLVVDYEADSVSAYYNRDSQNAGFTNTNLVDRTDDESHPFYEKWHISIPKGIKGDALENFRVITASSSDGVESYDGQADDRANGRQILVYDYYHFDKEEGGEPVTIYLGDYNMISGIRIDEDGSVTIEYTHDDDTIFEKAIKWIDSITLGEDGTLTIYFNTGEKTVWSNILKWVTSVELTETGHFTIKFNNGDAAYETDIIWVREVSFDETGIVTVTYNNGTTTTYPNIKWITEISLSEDGSFHIGFNNGDKYDANLVWVKEVSFDETGIVTVTYNNGTTTTYPNIKWITEISLSEDGSFHIGFNNGDKYDANIIWVREVSFDEIGIVTITYNNGTTTTYPNIKWITEISLSEDGSFHIDFNNGDKYDANLVWVKNLNVSNVGVITITYNDGTTQTLDNTIKWISNVSINTGNTEGTGNQKVHVVYNTNEEEDIGQPLNYIMQMEMVDSNYHLLVWYSDPAKRQEIIDEGKSYVFNGEDGWFDLGSVKDDSGILIGTNYEYELPNDITQEVINEIANLLDATYPDGLEGTDLKGKVITVGTDDINNKVIYAYDYDQNSWYYIGTLGDSLIKPENIVLLDTEIMTKTDNLYTGGLFFVIEDYSNYE